MKGCCNNCDHWQTDGKPTDPQKKRFLECRRNPPQILVGSYLPNEQGGLAGKVLTYWPRTGEDQGCGEFIPRKA